MSVLEHYLNKHRLEKISDRQKKRLEDLEKKLDEKVQSSDSFDDCLTNYGAELADLIERAANALENFSLSLEKLRIVINIGIEVYQLVDQMEDCVIPGDLPEEEKKEAKIDFGEDLVYFIWSTIDPLKNLWNWLPFKKTIEEYLVRLLARYALETAYDMLQNQVESFAVEQKAITVRTLAPVSQK